FRSRQPTRPRIACTRSAAPWPRRPRTRSTGCGGRAGVSLRRGRPPCGGWETPPGGAAASPPSSAETPFSSTPAPPLPPAPRGRRDDDEFPFAALDPVHAGGGVLRARGDEARLCPRDRRGLPVLFLRRCLPAVPAAGSCSQTPRRGPWVSGCRRAL